MSPTSKEIVLSRSEALIDSRKQGTSLSLPLAIYHRLDLLTDAARAAQATRAEIIGTLIKEAEIDPDALELAVLRYRKARVGDVVPERQVQPEPQLEDAENVVAISTRGPGRRTNSV